MRKRRRREREQANALHGRPLFACVLVLVTSVQDTRPAQANRDATRGVASFCYSLRCLRGAGSPMTWRARPGGGRFSVLLSCMSTRRRHTLLHTSGGEHTDSSIPSPCENQARSVVHNLPPIPSWIHLSSTRPEKEVAAREVPRGRANYY